MRWTLLLLCVAAPLAAQQVDTTLGLRRGRAVELSGTTGTVEVRTWSRPEVRVQVRGAGVSRVRVWESASRVFVQESNPRPDSVIWRFTDSTGALTATIGVRPPAIVVPPGRGPIAERGTVRVDTARRPVVERGTVQTDSAPTRLGTRGSNFITERGSVAARETAPASVDYVITVPERAHLIIRGNTVDVSISGALDTLELSNVKGNIRATTVAGHLTISSLEGRVLVEGSSGDLFARTLSGGVVIRDAAGSVEAQGVAGSIELMDVRATRIKASTYDGGIRFDGALPLNGTIEISTMRGPIAFPSTGACTSVLPEGKLQQIRPAGNRMYSILLVTATPTGVRTGPATCTMRRE